jgi:hypothetical protein
MAETKDPIETHLETTRGDLRSNLEELEDKVKSVTDWRQQFRNNPALMLGLAFGGGMLLAGVLRRPRRAAEHRLSPAAARGREPRRPEGRRTRMRQVWEDIQGALFGAATSKITSTLADVVPGLRDHLRPTPSGTTAHTGSASNNGNGVQGEGDDQAARRYAADVGQFVRSADIELAAREAAPRSEDEARELADAEAAGRRRAKPS